MVSVVIPSYNSEKTIEKCLQSLYDQNYMGNFEIILVDSSNDKTQEIVKSLFPEVKIIGFSTKTDPGTARNAGVAQSKGDLILFIDSDCVAEKDWISKMISIHEKNPDIAAVGGSALNGNDPNSQIAWASYIAEFREFIPENPAGFVWHIPTLNISYKRWVFDKYGFFDPLFYPQEDLVYNYRLTQAGEKIYFDPTIGVNHTHRSEIRGFVRHQRNIGKITAQVLKILPLQGHLIARKKFLYIFLGPLLPIVKFVKTVVWFARLNRAIILQHPLSIFFLKVGLFYWFIGFTTGVFSEKLRKVA